MPGDISGSQRVNLSEMSGLPRCDPEMSPGTGKKMTLNDELPISRKHHWPQQMLLKVYARPQRDCHNCYLGADSNKCCDYFPFVPNWLVGTWIETQIVNQKTLERFINEGLLLPIGILPSAELQQNKRLGSAAIRCPMLDDRGLCQVWRERPAECIGHFCDQGKKDLDSSQALKSTLNLYDQSLAAWWLLANEVPWAQVQIQLTALEDASTISLEQAQQLWRTHPDPITFFLKARSWQQQVTSDQAQEWLADEWQESIRRLEATL